VTNDQRGVSNEEIVECVQVKGDILKHSNFKLVVNFARLGYSISILNIIDVDSLDFTLLSNDV
jgi:hypothetical protein